MNNQSLSQPTTQEQKSIDTITIDVSKEVLTAEEIKFANLVARGYSLTKAYRLSFPAKKHLQNNTVRANASELLTKPEISTEVSISKEKHIRLARLAEDRIEDTLVNGGQNKSTNDVAMFMFEHANGKAAQKIQVEGRHVSVTYDLSGGKGGPVPQEVLDRLEQANNQ